MGRILIGAVIASLLLTACGAGAQVAPSGTPTPKVLRKIVYANAAAGASPYQSQIFAGLKLGYYAEEGLVIENQSFGSNAAVQAALEQGKAEFGVGVPSFQLELAAKQGPPKIVNFYEHTYPFKWDWVVMPDSPITSLGQLRGKKVGVASLGISDYQIGQQMLKLAGVDPASVEWVVVGAGLTGATALQKKSVDAEINVDTAFSLWESAGIATRILPRPAGLPAVGGVYLQASKDVLRDQRPVAVGFARAVAKGTIFCIENPRACAYLFLQTFPENTPQGQSLSQQVDTIAASFLRRSKLWTPTNPTVKLLGQVSTQEWLDEIAFAGLGATLKDPNIFFTNDLIEEANRFDAEAIRKQARDFKIPAN